MNTSIYFSTTIYRPPVNATIQEFETFIEKMLTFQIEAQEAIRDLVRESAEERYITDVKDRQNKSLAAILEVRQLIQARKDQMSLVDSDFE